MVHISFQVFSFSLDKYLEVELLDHMIVVNLYDLGLGKGFREDRKNINHKSKKLTNQTSSNFKIFCAFKDTVK